MPAESDTEIYNHFIAGIKSWDQLLPMISLMEKGGNPLNFANPGGALTQMKLAYGQLYNQIGGPTLGGILPGDAAAFLGNAVGAVTGAIGNTPNAQIPNNAGNLPSGSGGTGILPPIPGQPNIPGQPQGGAIGVPVAPPPRAMPTPKGGVPDGVIVILINDP